MITRKFLKNSILYSIAGALPMASMVILVPFYLLLPKAEFGELAIYTTFATLLQIIITYSFDSSLYLYYHDFKNEAPKLASLVSSVFILIGIAGLAMLAAGMLSGDLLFGLVWKDKPVHFYPYGLMSLVTAVFQAFFKVHSSLAQSREKAVVFFWSNVFSFGMIAALTLAGLLIFPGTLIGPVGGRMIAAILAGVWAVFRIFREFGFQFNWPLIRSTLAYNNVSFIYQVQQWVINSFDRIVIGIYLTLSDVGTYDLAFKCMLLITFIVDGLNNTIQPKVISIVAEQTTKESTVVINRYYYGLMAVTMVLVCGIVLLAPLAFDSGFIPDKYLEYRESLHYLPFIGVLYFARAIRYYYVLPFGALKYVKPLPIVYLVVSGVKVALMIVFIRSYSLYAVIASAGVSSLIEIAILHAVLRGKFHFRYNLFKLIIAPVFLAALIVAMEITVPFQEHFRHMIYMAGCLSLLAWVYRNELKLLKPQTLFK